MPADSNIFQQYLQAPKSVLDYQAQYDQADARKNALQLSAMDLSEKTQANQRAQKVRNALEALGASTTDEARINALKATATPEGFAQADALDKSIQERLKTKAVTGKDNAETEAKKLDSSIKAHDFHVQQLGAVSDPQTAQQWAIAGLQSGVFTPEQFQRGYANIPSDPAGFEQWKQRAMQGGVAATEQLKMAQAKLIADNSNATSRANNRDTNATHVQTTGMTNATTRRGQDLMDQRSRDANAQGKVPTGYRQKADGSLEFIPGGPADPNVGGGKLTEDQGKATGWLIQAENAYKNMMSASDPKATFSPATPGLGDAVAAVPGLGGLGNSMRSNNRQKFVQSASSLSEALLRAATGAGVNKDEAKQKIEELTPQWGDREDVIKQKTDAIPLYIESLKVRAGPGARKAAVVMEGAPTAGPKPGTVENGYRFKGGNPADPKSWEKQ